MAQDILNLNSCQSPPASGMPPRFRSGRRNRSKHGGRLPRLQSIENRARQPVLWVPPTAPESAIKRTRSGAEQRARTTTVALATTAQNGTYACARVLQACSALGGLGHAANRWYGAPSTEVPCLTFAGPAADVLLQLRLRAVSSRYSQSMTVVSVP